MYQDESMKANHGFQDVAGMRRLYHAWNEPGCDTGMIEGVHNRPRRIKGEGCNELRRVPFVAMWWSSEWIAWTDKTGSEMMAMVAKCTISCNIRPSHDNHD